MGVMGEIHHDNFDCFEGEGDLNSSFCFNNIFYQANEWTRNHPVRPTVVLSHSHHADEANLLSHLKNGIVFSSSRSSIESDEHSPSSDELERFEERLSSVTIVMELHRGLVIFSLRTNVWLYE
jgi:hypothetical protein